MAIINYKLSYKELIQLIEGKVVLFDYMDMDHNYSSIEIKSPCCNLNNKDIKLIKDLIEGKKEKHSDGLINSYVMFNKINKILEILEDSASSLKNECLKCRSRVNLSTGTCISCGYKHF